MDFQKIYDEQVKKCIKAQIDKIAELFFIR